MREHALKICYAAAQSAALRRPAIRHALRLSSQDTARPSAQQDCSAAEAAASKHARADADGSSTTRLFLQVCSGCAAMSSVCLPPIVCSWRPQGASAGHCSPNCCSLLHMADVKKGEPCARPQHSRDGLCKVGRQEGQARGLQLPAGCRELCKNRYCRSTEHPESRQGHDQ